MCGNDTYEVRGLTFDGKTLTGSAWLTHDIPSGTVITSPADGSVVPTEGLVVEWEPVTQTWDGEAVTTTGYQVIVTNEEQEDVHGWAQPIYDVHVPPTLTSLEVPDAFLEPGTVYEIEVLSIETSGNQTITTIFFETE